MRSRALPASRGDGAGFKDAARRLRRSPSAILEPGTVPARCDRVAGTEERPLRPNKGTGLFAVLLLGIALFAACRAEQAHRQEWTAADNLFLREFQALADAVPELAP